LFDIAMTDTFPKQLLIIWDSMTGGSKALAQAAADGAAAQIDVTTTLNHCSDVSADMMCRANGYLFCFPENLAAISGVMKSFFDRSYYPCLGRIEGRPYAMIVCAGSDGSNAVKQAERIATGWRLKKIAESTIVCTHAQTPETMLAAKVIDIKELQMASELGEAMAEGIALGVF
jgi:multimeric flavodoxin WrbA